MCIECTALFNRFKVLVAMAIVSCNETRMTNPVKMQHLHQNAQLQLNKECYLQQHTAHMTHDVIVFVDLNSR